MHFISKKEELDSHFSRSSFTGSICFTAVRFILLPVLFSILKVYLLAIKMKKRAIESIAKGVLWFDFLGFVVKINATKSLLTSLYKDYSYFLGEEDTPDLQFKVIIKSPDYKNLPPIPSSYITPRNIVFKKGKVSYIDYFGKALSVLDRDNKKCDVFTLDKHLAHEICYLTILSFVGKHLDKEKLHRIHALGLRYRDKSIVVLLPSGGGKTTIALRILREKDFQLLSEDSPLVDKKGNVHPFPMRIGMVETEIKEKIPEEYTEKIERMEFGPKRIVDIEYFSDSLGKVSPPGLLLVGIRALGNECRIVRMGRLETYRHILKNGVIGMGIYQGLEFIFSRKISGLMELVPVFLSRLRNLITFANKSRAFKVFLGYDHGINIAALLDFIRKNIVEF